MLLHLSRVHNTVLLHLSRVHNTVLRCRSRAVRLRDRSLVPPRGLVTLRLRSSRLPPGSMVLRRDPGTLLRLSRVVRLPVGSTVLLRLSRARSTVRPRGPVTLRLLSSRLPVGSMVLLRLSRVCRLRDRSLVLRRDLGMLPRLSSRLPPGSMVLQRAPVMLPRLSSRLPAASTALPQPRATPQNLSRKITLTLPRIAMPSPSRRLILSPVPQRPLRLTMLAFPNPVIRLSRSRRQPQPTPPLLQQGSIPLSRRRCLHPTR